MYLLNESAIKQRRQGPARNADRKSLETTHQRPVRPRNAEFVQQLPNAVKFVVPD